KPLHHPLPTPKPKDPPNLLHQQKQSPPHQLTPLKHLTNQQPQAFNQPIKHPSTKQHIHQVIDHAKPKHPSNLLHKQKSPATNQLNPFKHLSQSQQQPFNKPIQHPSSKEH
ncbi:GA module-containing protein, partial [Staphylococcus auricularis]|uniref:GA module-containing protein n=1 Tax=Staphylococcus auricularis TaxID=29379 RepID=UPI001CDA1319